MHEFYWYLYLSWRWEGKVFFCEMSTQHPCLTYVELIVSFSVPIRDETTFTYFWIKPWTFIFEDEKILSNCYKTVKDFCGNFVHNLQPTIKLMQIEANFYLCSGIFQIALRLKMHFMKANHEISIYDIALFKTFQSDTFCVNTTQFQYRKLTLW